ncbi:MAG: hypothetical protein K0S78_1782 [Thermomicrobiales bacterium]|nr:hypothetical protein [Thermomicrobiales bacterium]
MRWCAVAGGTVFAAFLILFLIGEAWQAPLLTDPAAQLQQADLLTALLGVGLLVVDAVLPVPASLVMIAHGALFGVVLGTLLSLLGSLGAMLVGFALGRRGGALLTRFVSPRERATADRLLERWGALAIVVTRPVPLLAETTAVLAGASSLGWQRATLAAFAGAVPTAVIYALAGALAVGLDSGALVFAATLVALGGVWLADRHLARRRARDREGTAVTAGSAP